MLVGRHAVRWAIGSVIDAGEPSQLLVVGPDGSGRSAVLAEALRADAAAVPADGGGVRRLRDRLEGASGLLVVADDVDRLPAADRAWLTDVTARQRHRLIASAATPWVDARPQDPLVQAATRHDLPPLTEVDVATLLGRLRVDAESRRLHAESGGNPAVLVALLGTGTIDDLVQRWRRRIATDALTMAVVAVAAHRIRGEGRVEPEAVVAGVGAAAATTTLIADGDVEAEAQLSIDRLVARGFLRRTPGRVGLFVTHPAMIDAWIRSSPESPALIAARVVADGRARGVRSTLLVHQAALTGVASTVHAVVDAADRDLAAGVVADPQERVRAAAAVVHATDEGDPRRSARLARLGAAHAGVGDLDGVRRVLAMEGDVVALVALEQMIDPASIEGSMPTGDPVVDLTGALLRGEPVEAIIERLDRFEPPVGRADRLRWIGLRALLAVLDAAPTAPDLVDEALAVFDAAVDADVGHQVLAAHLVAQAALSAGRLEDADRVIRRCCDLAEGTGQRHLLPILATTTARVAYARGDVETATEEILGAVEVLRGQRSGVHLTFSLSIVAGVLAMRDDTDAARRLVHEVMVALLRGAPTLLDVGAAIYAARALVVVGASHAAADVVISAGGGDDLHRIPRGDRALGYEVLVSAAVDRGDLDDAAGWLRRARTIESGPAGRAAVVRAEAKIAAARSRSAGAARAARLAAMSTPTAAPESLSSSPSPSPEDRVEAARRRLLGAVSSSRSGRVDPAVAELRWVRETCGILGSEVFTRAPARQLRRLGRRPSAGGGGLTSREAEVAALVSSGLTNRQVAGVLFIGEAAVEAHLARAMSKVGETSRTGLARRIGENAEVWAAPPADQGAASWDDEVLPFAEPAARVAALLDRASRQGAPPEEVRRWLLLAAALSPEGSAARSVLLERADTVAALHDLEGDEGPRVQPAG